MTVNSSANSVILILFAFSENISAENSKLSAGFKPQLPQLLECMRSAFFNSFFLTPSVTKIGMALRAIHTWTFLFTGDKNPFANMCFSVDSIAVPLFTNSGTAAVTPLGLMRNFQWTINQ